MRPSTWWPISPRSGIPDRAVGSGNHELTGRGSRPPVRAVLSRWALALSATAVLVLSPVGPIPVAPVLAHCPGNAAHDYAAGGQSVSQSNGVRGTIGWVQGNVCTSGVSHSVTICRPGSCGHWAQVGWRYYDGYPEPRMYCEWAGSQYKLIEFGISHAAHEYRQQFDTQDDYWDCYLDSTAKYAYTWQNAGFSYGTWFVAQGENHQAHVQIGRMAPNKLLFDAMKRRRTSDNTWVVANVNPGVSGGPYGADEPAAGDMRVWTNAH